MSDDMARCVSVPLDRCMGRAENPRRPAELTAAEFWPQIHAAWRLSTDLANWGVHELIRLDVRREPGQARTLAAGHRSPEPRKSGIRARVAPAAPERVATQDHSRRVYKDTRDGKDIWS